MHRFLFDDTAAARAPVPPSVSRRPLFPLVDVWLGAMVPKRWARRAVTRNTIKRQIYHVSLEFESALPMAAHVVRLRRAFDRSSFCSATSVALKTAVRDELMQLFISVAQPGDVRLALAASRC